MNTPSPAPAPPGLWRRFLTAGVDASWSAEARRLLRFHRVCILALVWIGPAFIWFSFADQSMTALVIHSIGTVSSIVALALTLRGRHLASKVLYTYGALVWVAAVWWHVLPLGFAHIWFLLTLVYSATVFRGGERVWKYTGIVVSGLLFCAGTWAEVAVTRPPIFDVSSEMDRNLYVFSGFSLALSLSVIAAFASEQMRVAEARLVHEHARSEGLLLNILPKPIAERLKASPEVIADGFPHVTVLFSDIVGFTPLSEKLQPTELVAMLNTLFTGFDRIAARHGLEKIKTIGDAYMVASGVPVPSVRHAHPVAEMALEMCAFMAEFRAQFDDPVDIRIGIHSGPVVAGVIGESKFAYDLWGDTVNVASRMESAGVPGRIHVSDATRALLADDYALELRGEVELKGKGARKTWFLVGREA